MNNQLSPSGIGMFVVNACLIVQVDDDVDEHDVRALGKEILEQIKASEIKKILINISTVKVMDSITFVAFRNLARAISLLGALVVFVGFQPGVASVLVDLDVPLDDILTAVSMEDGFKLLNSRESTLPESEVVDDEVSGFDALNEFRENISEEMESGGFRGVEKK